jgi:sialate O-acetylesterase
MTKRQKSFGAFAIISCALLLTPSTLQAQDAEPTAASVTKPAIELGAPFRDDAVLQREMKLPVWGWSKPGTKVTVEFAGQNKSATAGNDGKWVLELDPLKASFEPATMTVTENAGKSVTLNNLLVGEVWLASGQSNMQWTVSKSTSNDLVTEPRADGVVPIREFTVGSVTAQLHPIEKATGAWKNGNYGTYSAIAFAFAHKLYHELNVPVGILNGSFSETSINSWTPRVGFRDGMDEYTNNIYQRILESDPATSEHKVAWEQYYQEFEDGIAENATRIARGEPAIEVTAKRPGNLNGNRDASWLFNGRINPLVPYAIRGAIWNQGYANMGEGIVYYNNLHSLIRGWRIVWNRPELPVYFHQFYTPGGAASPYPTVGGVSEMRLGTLMARDIPHTGMASQIDVGGAIHYNQKAVPGQRLALHALKNQYGKSGIVSDGPIFKSYEVKGRQLIVSFDHAEGGLQVATTKPNEIIKPAVIENGETQVKLFYLAGADRVWHPASVKIDGDKVMLTADGVDEPKGVSYAAGGVSWQPNLYNKALLPMSPFIYYDHQPALESNWPDLPMKIAGVEQDGGQFGLAHVYRKMPLLSSQFRENAVLQAGQPVTIWGGLGVGSAQGEKPRHEGAIVFRFAASGANAAAIFEKTIPVTKEMKEWQVTLPPMPAGDKTYTMNVAFKIAGEVVHERNITGMVFGDVFYMVAPAGKLALPASGKTEEIVRVMRRSSKRDRNQYGSRFSVSGSTTTESRFAEKWQDADTTVFAGALGHRIAAKTGNPVGIIFMQAGTEAELKEWIAAEDLKSAPSLMEDYKDLMVLRPGNEDYDANIRRHIADWKNYWSKDIPRMIATRSVPEGSGWGRYPGLAGQVTSIAGRTFNVMTLSFTPASLKGIVFITSPSMMEKAGSAYEEQMSTLTKSWKAKFTGDPFFLVIDVKETATRLVEQIDKNIK